MKCSGVSWLQCKIRTEIIWRIIYAISKLPLHWELGQHCIGNVSHKGQTLQAQSDRREMKVERQRYKTGVIIPQLCNLAGGLPQQIEEDVQGGGGRGWALTLGLVDDLFLQPTPLLCLWLVGMVAPLNLERLPGRGSKTRLRAKEASAEVGDRTSLSEEVSQTTNSYYQYLFGRLSNWGEASIP